MKMKILLKIHCWDCKEKLGPEDFIKIDEMYTLSHDFCRSSSFKIRDVGTFKEIAKKYPYFHKNYKS